MKKIIFCILFTTYFSILLNAQLKNIKYLQLNATVDILGNIKFTGIEKLSKKTLDNQDSVSSYKVVNNIILKSNNAIDAINSLSQIGWALVTTTSITKDELGRPNTSFIAYYFRKE